MTGVPGVSILLLALRALSLSPQALSDTSGWALRIQRNCPAGQSECGPTANGFVACCPASSPCMNQYNDVCCPPGTNCTDTLVEKGPFCADPTWVLCDNNGYFCCLPGQICYSSGNTDRCEASSYIPAPHENRLNVINQVQRPSATKSAVSATPSTSTKSARDPSGGLSTSDKIAIGIGVPVGVISIFGVYVTWKLYQMKKNKRSSA